MPEQLKFTADRQDLILADKSNGDTIALIEHAPALPLTQDVYFPGTKGMEVKSIGFANSVETSERMLYGSGGPFECQSARFFDSMDDYRAWLDELHDFMNADERMIGTVSDPWGEREGFRLVYWRPTSQPKKVRMNGQDRYIVLYECLFVKYVW